MKKMLFKTILLGIAAVSLSDTAKACSCAGSGNICEYLNLNPNAVFFRIRVDTLLPPVQSLPFPDYGVTIIDQYNGNQTISQTYWLTGENMGSCARSLDPDAQVGDTFLVTLLHADDDTGSLWTCSFVQRIKNDSLYEADQPSFPINALQDTITTCLERNVGTKNVDLFHSIHIYPNPAREMLNINNESGATVLSVELLDITGRKVLHQEGKNLNELPVGPINNGLYFIRIRTDEGIITRKINIEK